MVINNKFNLGDKVYFIDGRRIKEGKVTMVDMVNEMFYGDPIISVYYRIDSSSEDSLIDEEDVFASKEELIKSS